MKYLEITVGKSLNVNSGEEWYKGDVRVSIDDGESVDRVFQDAKEKIDSLLPNPFGQNLSKPQPKEKIEPTEVGMLNAINSCTEIKVLETFRLLVKNNPQFQSAYDNKLKALSK